MTTMASQQVTRSARRAPEPGGRAAAQPASATRAAPRHFPARYKIAILSEYDTLDRAGKTALLRRERLRASQLSEWRRMVYAAALQALSAEPGSQPAHRIHASGPLWHLFTEAAASQPTACIRKLTARRGHHKPVAHGETSHRCTS